MEPHTVDEYEARADDATDEPAFWALLDALSLLTAKQRFVVDRRYGLLADGRRYTLQEIARVMGVSHQAVSRLEQSALGVLQNFYLGERG